MRPRLLDRQAWEERARAGMRTIDTSYVTGELVDYLSRDGMAHIEHSLSRHPGLLR